MAPCTSGSVVFLVGCVFANASFAPAARAAGPRVLPPGQVPQDRRLGPLKDLDGFFPFIPPATRQAWEERARRLRRQVLVATGLWPMPKRTPLNPVIFGRVDRPSFTVEKVYFESYPGHFVTGLLFRPKAATGRRPGVLCPHGHGGRLQDYGAKKIRHLLVQGAERFESSGRYPKLARCAQLARMGCVTFIFDMLGYADSVQISRQLAHRFSTQRPEFDTKTSWGFYSTQAELRLQSIMGLQTYNSIRALDFLCGLPDVDSERIGVTGGSGGGTQTILLCAIDPRPVVAFPQGMVSTAMQGGCTCENCSLLRIGTGNVELAALFAPKPLGMTAANDWTKEMMTKGYPQLQQLYELYGMKNRVLCKPLLHFPHNYNYVTRAVMYSWFNKHLKLGLPEPIVEEDFRALTPEEWTVWDAEHPRPTGGAAYERSLTALIHEASIRKLAALTPTDVASLARYRHIVGGAFETIIGRTLSQVGAIDASIVGQEDRGDHREVRMLVRRKHDGGEELPVVALRPTKGYTQAVIWVDGRGKAGLYGDDGSPRPAVRKLLAGGIAVIGADLLYQGESLVDGAPLREARTVANPREFAGYTFCYNHTVFAQRVHDVLMLVSAAQKGGPLAPHTGGTIHLLGVNEAGPLAAAAASQAGTAIDRVAVDTGGFRFVNLTSYRDLNFLPGAVKYGDLPGLMALAVPHPLWLAGEGNEVPAIVSAAYRAVGQGGRVQAFRGEREAVPQAAAQWMVLAASRR